MRPHYRIGNRPLPFAIGVGLVLAGILLVAGLGQRAPTAPPPAGQAAQSAAALPAATAASAGPSSTRDPRAPIPNGYRVQIPRLRIDLPVAEGDIARDIDQQRTPENAAFHLPGTSIPGLGSNTYLYAHARAGMFLSLWDAKVGDVVWISTPDLHALKYVVSEVHPRVAPGDVSWAQATNGERLTLQTSTGPDPSDPRFVVVAVPET